MLHTAMIAAARRGLYTLEVVSQITGVPQRVITAAVKPEGTWAGVEVYRLTAVVQFFSSESGARLLRKLRQNPLEIFRDCRVTWRDAYGTVHLEHGCFVEVRGKHVEITLPTGHRMRQRIEDPAFSLQGTKV